MWFKKTTTPVHFCTLDKDMNYYMCLLKNVTIFPFSNQNTMDWSSFHTGCQRAPSSRNSTYASQKYYIELMMLQEIPNMKKKTSSYHLYSWIKRRNIFNDETKTIITWLQQYMVYISVFFKPSQVFFILIMYIYSPLLIGIAFIRE